MPGPQHWLLIVQLLLYGVEQLLADKWLLSSWIVFAIKMVDTNVEWVAEHFVDVALAMRSAFARHYAVILHELSNCKY